MIPLTLLTIYVIVVNKLRKFVSSYVFLKNIKKGKDVANDIARNIRFKEATELYKDAALFSLENYEANNKALMKDAKEKGFRYRVFAKIFADKSRHI